MPAILGGKSDAEIRLYATEGSLALKCLIEMFAFSKQTDNLTKVNDRSVGTNSGFWVNTVGRNAKPIAVPIVD